MAVPLFVMVSGACLLPRRDRPRKVLGRMARIVAALLENYQTPEGIRIPEALIPYTGFDIIK